MYKNQFAGHSHPAVFSLRHPLSATRVSGWLFPQRRALRRRSGCADGTGGALHPLRLAARKTNTGNPSKNRMVGKNKKAAPHPATRVSGWLFPSGEAGRRLSGGAAT